MTPVTPVTVNATAKTIILVDDHEMFRDALCAYLARESDLQVIAQTGSGQEGCVLVAERRPDVLVVDIELPDLDGISLTRTVRALSPPPAVLILSVYAEATHYARALAVGAAGYICKDETAEDLMEAIRTVARGGTWFRTLAGRGRGPTGSTLLS